MLDHVDRPVVLQLLADQRRDRELLCSHDGIARMNGGKRAREAGDVRVEDALELDERLLVEADVVEVVDQQPLRSDSIGSRSPGSPGRASCRVKRSSEAAATTWPSRIRQAAES